MGALTLPMVYKKSLDPCTFDESSLSIGRVKLDSNITATKYILCMYMYIDQTTSYYVHFYHFKCKLTHCTILVESLNQLFRNKMINAVYSMYIALQDQFFQPSRYSIFFMNPMYIFHTSKHKKQFRGSYRMSFLLFLTFQ